MGNSSTESKTGKDDFGNAEKFSLREFFSLEGLFSGFMNQLGNIIWIGMLWLVTSIPLVTMGCSAVGSCRALDASKKQKGYITKEFFAGFSAEWKKAIPAQIINLVFFAWLIFDCIYLYGYGTEAALVISYVLYGILFFAVALNCYYYPCLIFFEGNFFEIFKIAFYMMFRHLLTTIVLVGLLAAAVLAVYLMPWSIMIVPGLWWYAETYFVGKIVSHYMAEEE